MRNLVSDLASGFGRQTTPNPDLNHNVKLLREAKGLIESGTFTHYFKKSFLVMMEVISYSITVLLFIAGVYLFLEIKPIFTILTSDALKDLLSKKDIDTESLNFLKTGIYILLFLPFIISIFWSRGYTKSRRRINLIRRVEAIISQVITNLGAGLKKVS